MVNLKMLGVIQRNCERCGEPKECNCFEVDGKNHIMCAKCTYEKFRYGKKSQDEEMEDFELCKTCNLMTMRKDKDKTEITDKYVISHFQCAKCGERIKKRAKLRIK